MLPQAHLHPRSSWLRAATLLLIVLPAFPNPAATRFVAAEGSSPAHPFASWETAASSIQDALLDAPAGTEIVVTNGVYNTGGRFAYESNSRVVLDKPVTVRSVNGPGVTRIEGGPGMRCALVSDGATLSGFTLAGGHGVLGGGVWCRGTPEGVLPTQGRITHCIIVENQAERGGGVWGGHLLNCRIERNTALEGAGVFGSRTANTLITENLANREGGGALAASLTNCTVLGNRALFRGGGVVDSSLVNSIVYFNTALTSSNHHQLTSAHHSCTAPLARGTGNLDQDPGLASFLHLGSGSPCLDQADPELASGFDLDGQPWSAHPSIGADQFSPANATSPLTIAIAIDAERTRFGPGVAASFKARIGGPVSRHVWDFGDGTRVTNQPLAIHTWTKPGHYLIHLSASLEPSAADLVTSRSVEVLALPTLFVNASNPAPAFPFDSWETAATTIQDAVDASEAGQTIRVADGIYQTGGRTVEGIANRVAIEHPVRVESVNGPSVTIIRGGQDSGFTRGVQLADGAVLSGFTVTGGTIWLNGPEGEGGGIHCAPGAVVTNCWILDNTCESRRGGGVWGGTLLRCRLDRNLAGIGGAAYGSQLHDCLLSGNAAGNGGGAYDATLFRCTIVSNTAFALRSNFGGGVAHSAMFHCLLTHNRARFGGGAHGSILHHCTVVENLGTSSGTLPAGDGAGVANCQVWNSILRRNSPAEIAVPSNFDASSVLENSCTEPLPPLGTGNLSRDPEFVNPAAGNYHLLPGSPCIDAAVAVNPPLPSRVDLDGKPRPLDGRGTTAAPLASDLGAFEFLRPESDSNRDGIPDGWTWDHHLDPTAAGLATADPDLDGMPTFDEWIADTDPLDPASSLRLETTAAAPPLRLSLQSSRNRIYSLESRILDGPAPQPWRPVEGRTNVQGSGGSIVLTEPLAGAGVAALYRIRVDLP